MQFESVTRADGDGCHRRQGVGVEVRKGRVQQSVRPGVVVVEVRQSRFAVVVEARHPASTADVGRQRRDVTVGQLLQVLEHSGEVGVEPLDHLTRTEIPHAQQVTGATVQDQRPGEPEPHLRTRIDAVGRMAVDVGLLAGGHVQPHQGGPVRVAVGADPEALAVGGDGHREDAERVVGPVVGGERAQRLRGRLPAGHLHVAAVGQRHREQLTGPAAEPRGDGAGVLGQQREVAGGDVQFVGVVQIGPSLVHSDERLARAVGQQFEVRPDAGERREVDDRRGRIVEVHPVHVPVLVAAVVLGVEQPPRVVGPLVVQHAAGLIGRHAAGVVGIGGVRALYPHVQTVPPGREEGDSAAVGRDGGRGPVRGLEQVFDGDAVVGCHALHRTPGRCGTVKRHRRHPSWRRGVEYP